MIDVVSGIGCWLLGMVRRHEGWRLGAEVVLIGGGRWLGLGTMLVRRGTVGL